MGEQTYEPAAGSGKPGGTRRSGRLRTLGVGVLVFVVNAVSPSPQVGDSRLSVITAWQFLRHWNLHLEHYPAVNKLSDSYDLVHHHGHLLPFFPWPTMLFAIPADILYRLTGHDPALVSISNPNHTWLLEVPTASLLVAITALIVRAIVRDLDGQWGRPSVALAAALTFAFCTSAWSVGSRALWQQTTSMLFLSAALLAMQRIDRGRWWPWLLGVFVMMAVVTRPTDAMTAVLAFAWVAWRKRHHLPKVLGGALVCLIPFVGFSYSQYGQLLPPYYVPSRLEQRGPFTFAGALSMNLISPSRGLIIYDPIVLLAAFGVVARIRARRMGELDLLVTIAIVGQWLTISAYESTGGATYGPRLMIDIVPYLVVLSVPALSSVLDWRRCHRLLARLALTGCLAVLVWGGAVNATGGLLRSAFCWSANPVPVDLQPSRVWDWGDPAFLRPYKDLLEGLPASQVVAGSCATLERDARAAGHSS